MTIKFILVKIIVYLLEIGYSRGGAQWLEHCLPDLIISRPPLKMICAYSGCRHRANFNGAWIPLETISHFISCNFSDKHKHFATYHKLLIIYWSFGYSMNSIAHLRAWLVLPRTVKHHNELSHVVSSLPSFVMSFQLPIAKTTEKQIGTGCKINALHNHMLTNKQASYAAKMRYLRLVVNTFI